MIEDVLGFIELLWGMIMDKDARIKELEDIINCGHEPGKCDYESICQCCKIKSNELSLLKARVEEMKKIIMNNYDGDYGGSHCDLVGEDLEKVFELLSLPESEEEPQSEEKKPEKQYFITCARAKGKRGLFVNNAGMGFPKEEEHTEEEMNEILGAFAMVLNPKSELFSEEYLKAYTVWYPLGEFSGYFGIALKEK